MPHIYLDNQATTRLDPRVVEAMLPWMTEHYGNPGSTTHEPGRAAARAVEESAATIATFLGCSAGELVFTSGATESNNLAIRGIAESRRRRGDHLISVATEHRAVLDPLDKLARHGFEVTLLPVAAGGTPEAGRVDLEQLREAIRPETCLVSVMMANNEIGVIQRIAEIGGICRAAGVPLHCDAAQAVGKLPVDVEALQVDLLSFSGHKIYGPRGMGGLYVRGRRPRVRLESQIDGGGQQRGRRSGTLNTSGIVGLAAALQLCQQEGQAERMRLMELRDLLWKTLQEQLPGLSLNGPLLPEPEANNPRRLPGNLNVCFGDVEGESLMLAAPRLAVSSGSACTSAEPAPSHVLRALGLEPDAIRSSLRFGLGRFTNRNEVVEAAEMIVAAAHRLRASR